MKSFRKVTMGAAIVAGGLAFAGSASAVELVVNGDFDDLSGWAGLTGTETINYTASPHPAGLSAPYFAGFANATVTTSQTLDVSGAVGQAYDYSMWLGAWYADDDHAIVTLEFFDGAGGTGSQVGSTVTFHGLTGEGYTGLTSSGPNATPSIEEWKFYQDLGVVPVGALSAVIFIDADTINNNANDNYVDGVSFDVIPEPASLALLGLGGLMMLRRKRA